MERSSAFHCNFPRSTRTVPTFDSSLNPAVAAGHSPRVWKISYQVQSSFEHGKCTFRR